MQGRGISLTGGSTEFSVGQSLPGGETRIPLDWTGDTAAGADKGLWENTRDGAGHLAKVRT
jgi:hypothetical protein